MLDIQFIRDNPELVEEKSKQKGYQVDIEKLLSVDEKRRALIVNIDTARSEVNSRTAGFAGKPPSEADKEVVRIIKADIKVKEEELEKLNLQYWTLLKAVPNMPLKSVPVGSTENENVVIKSVGEKPIFDFKIKNHASIAEAKGWIDRERAVKIAGARFVYIKGDLVRLEWALNRYGMDVLSNSNVLEKIAKENKLDVSSKAFVPVLPPAVAKKEVFEATGRLNREEQTYKFEDVDLWVNASAEHTLAPMYMSETLNEDELPIRYIGFTTAFRKEAGTYGKDTEGMFRLHQFNKLEMESFCTPESSLSEHLFMVAIQEYLMQQLGLPYHLLEKCTADIGRPNAKGVDIEAWLPSQETYRETHTADFIGDYQSRAMKTKLKLKDGTTKFVHTNDATVFAQRPLIAIIENYQTKDGDVLVPEVLQPYMNGKKEI